MSSTPDVSTMNETLAKRKGSACRRQIPSEIGSPDAASPADEINRQSHGSQIIHIR